MLSRGYAVQYFLNSVYMSRLLDNQSTSESTFLGDTAVKFRISKSYERWYANCQIVLVNKFPRNSQRDIRFPEIMTLQFVSDIGLAECGSGV